jgi:hypothetical protein
MDEKRRPYDVEGRSFTDIYVRYEINPFLPKNWDLLWDDIKHLAKSFHRETKYFLGDLRVKEYIQCLRGLFTYSNIFRIKRDSWVFTVNSLDQSLKSYSFDEAENIIARKNGYKDIYEVYEKVGPLTFSMEEIKEIQRNLLKNRNLLREKMVKDQGLVRIALGLDIQKDDPTVMVVNENVFPFKMKDGWDDATLKEIIEYWCTSYLKQVVIVELDNEEID